ncbi:rod shape-determining protein MreD [Parerythrobacter aestuarii]|uniref:rod shape-determining protein MreD n=1 Tax=Parerythrobacter aestuarii TaxID=3020909 RepID=UPI0024DEE32C|nr:rod shape-determining protein MreD [Parerythrobacter aestuarii]
MERLNPASRRDRYGSRINRDHSPLLLALVPWGSIMLGAIVPFFILTSGMPIVPPLAFLFLLGWRLVRPGVLPVWAGLPLGLWNDLFSGQPMGCSVLLFSLTMLAIEILDSRFPWRNFVQDWITASLAIFAFLWLGAMFSGADISVTVVVSILPQVVLAILAFPIVARLVAALDRIRLLRVRVIG